MPVPDFSAIHSPNPAHLTLYVLGTGYGESIVVALPRGGYVVVDCLRHRGHNLTRALLAHLGVHTIDLLILTHPDTDHIAGADELLHEHEVHRLWSYPASRSIRDVLAALLNQHPGDQRLAELRRLHQQVHEAVRAGTIRREGADQRWERLKDDLEILSVAPTSFDVVVAEEEVNRMIDASDRNDPQVAERVRRFLSKRTRAGDEPNRLSLAIAIRHGQRRVLLAGDVFNGADHALSGWRGVVTEQQPRGAERSGLHLLTDLDVIKVAHHGSKGAFSTDAWDLHARTRVVPVAVICPFHHGKVSLPDEDTLRHHLPNRVASLALPCDAGKPVGRALQAAWSKAHVPHPAPPFVAVIELPADGPPTTSVETQGALLLAPSASAPSPPGNAP